MKELARRLGQNSWRIIPKGILDNALWREKMLKKGYASQSVAQSLQFLARGDILFWVNAFVWTLDTRDKVNTTSPFITFGYQDEAILTLLHSILPFGDQPQHDVVVEKSRDMGATWMCSLVFLWLFLYHDDIFSLFCMSWAEKYVDGGFDSIMGKMDFVIERLPEWMLPGGTRQSIRRVKLSFENLLTGSTITGSATSSRSGIGGRYSAMFFDEFAAVAEAEDIWTKTADCTNARIFNSTHYGSQTVFNRICEQSKKEEQEAKEGKGKVTIRRVAMHWTRHPWKAEGLYYDDLMKPRSPWYDDQCRRRGYNRVAIAQQLDMDAQASGWQFFDPVEINRLVVMYSTDPGRIGRLIDGQMVTGSGGHLQLWFPADPPRGRYGLGADIASGSGGQFGTPSCLSIVNLETGEKVGQFADHKVRPDQFALLARDIALWFHGAIICWESAGPVGGAFKRAMLDDLGYPNVYTRRRNENSFHSESTLIPGWHPTADAKAELLESYRGAITSGQFLNRSKSALEECLQFVYFDGKVEHALERVKGDHAAAKSLHGDQVIADALAWLLVREAGYLKTKAYLLGGAETGEPPYASPAYWDKIDRGEEESAQWDGW